MEQEKIASKLILADGTTFNIGTVGVVENVAVKLSAPTSEDWASMKVVVQDITDGVNNGEYQLNSLGEAKFFIPMGHTYSVTLPIVGNYTQPLIITLTAQLASRVITHEYSMSEVQYEQINISALVVNGDVSMLNGKSAVAITEDNDYYEGIFVNGKATLNIPYGKKVEITMPVVEGMMILNFLNRFTTGLPSRDLVITYSEYLFGFFGIDDNGNMYDIATLEAMKEEGRSLDFIHYVGFNDIELATAERGDGTIGCGICMPVPLVLVKNQWASENVLFDPSRVAMHTSAQTTYARDYKSAYNTTQIITVGMEMEILTPASTYCRSQSITIASVNRTGNLIATGVLKKLLVNNDSWLYINELLGHTAVDFTKEDLLCSSQSNEESPSYFSKGNYLNWNYKKVSTVNHFVCYDL